MPVALVKPGTTAAQVIISAAGIGTDTADKFIIKVFDCTYQLWTPLADTTGDGDTAPTWETNRLLYGRFNLIGAMVAGQAVGFANLIVASPVLAGVQFLLGDSSARKITADVVVETVNFRWRRNANFVGLALSLRTTDTHPTEA